MQAEGRVLSQTDIDPDFKTQYALLKRLPLSDSQRQRLFKQLTGEEDVDAREGRSVRLGAEPKWQEEARCAQVPEKSQDALEEQHQTPSEGHHAGFGAEVCRVQPVDAAGNDDAKTQGDVAADDRD